MAPRIWRWRIARSCNAGETLVVLGAAGGVGLTAVEIGALMGARVIAVARGRDKLAVAARAGASVCLDSGADGFDLRATLKAEGGAHVIYDAIGEPLATPAMRALHPEGRFLAIGFAGGTPPAFPANILLVKNLSVIGLYWGAYLKFAPRVMSGSIATLFGWYDTGACGPHISHVLPLEHALATGWICCATVARPGKSSSRFDQALPIFPKSRAV